MKVYEEIDLCDFSPWAGAKAFVDRLTDEQKMVIQQSIEELYPQGLSQGDLNDILWFDTDWCCQCLGFEDYEDFLETL